MARSISIQLRLAALYLMHYGLFQQTLVSLGIPYFFSEVEVMVLLMFMGISIPFRSTFIFIS